MNNKVSIIVPNYNSSDNIKQCLNSILNLNYENFEIIIVDDGSTDKSVDICREYAKNNKCINFYTKSNGGVSSARNFGILKSSGDYIAFIDSDDYVNRDFIKELVKLISKQDVDAAVCGITKVSDYDFDVAYDSYNEKIITQDDAYRLMLIDENFFGYSCNKLYKRNIIVDNNIYFDENIHICEDFEFNSRYYEYVNNIGICTEKLYYYYENEKSATNDYSYSERQYSVLIAYENISKIYKKMNHDFYDLVIYNFIKNKLSINYRLHLINKELKCEIINFEEKRTIKLSKNLNFFKKKYILLSCHFPIISTALKRRIKMIRRYFK